MRSLLTDARFRMFWLGQATSVVGNGITMVALAALIIPARGGQAFGLVLATESLAMGVLLLGSGVVVDRCSRTAVMALADGLRAVAVIGFLLLARTGPLPALLLASALVGAGMALHQPAHRAVLPQLVDHDRLQQANAVDAATNRLGLGAGTALGGVLVAGWGAQTALVVDLLTFMVSLLTLLWLRLPSAVAEWEGGMSAPQHAASSSALQEAREGIREVRRRPWVAVLMAQGTAQVLFLFGPTLALVPVVTIERYGSSALGWFTTCGFLGSAAGSALVARRRPRLPGWTAMNGLAAACLLPLLLVVHLPLPVFCAVNLVAGAGIGQFSVLWSAALQREFPQHVQGRVFSLDGLVTFALQPVALSLAPVLAASVGMLPLAIGATLLMLVFTYGALRVPGVARLRSPQRV